MRFLKVLPLMAAMVFFPACSHITPVEQELLDCGSASVQAKLGGPGGLVNTVLSYLNSGQINWQSSLDTLLGVAGPAVICAVQVAEKTLTGGNAGAAASIAAVHANMWLVTDGHYKLVKNQN